MYLAETFAKGGNSNEQPHIETPLLHLSYMKIKYFFIVKNHDFNVTFVT